MNIRLIERIDLLKELEQLVLFSEVESLLHQREQVYNLTIEVYSEVYLYLRHSF